MRGEKKATRTWNTPCDSYSDMKDPTWAEPGLVDAEAKEGTRDEYLNGGQKRCDRSVHHG